MTAGLGPGKDPAALASDDSRTDIRRETPRGASSDANSKPGPVARAVACIERANLRLINLLKSPDDSVRARAATGLRGLDPPPVWDLMGAFVKAKDAAFKVAIVRVLGG